MEIMIVVGNRCIHLPAQVEEAEFVVEVAAFFVGGGFVVGRAEVCDSDACFDRAELFLWIVDWEDAE